MIKNTTRIGYVNIENETIFEVGRFAILWNVFENTKCNNKCTCAKIVNMEKSIKNSDKEPFERFATELKNRANKIGRTVDKYVNNNVFPINGAIISATDRTNYMPAVIEFIDSSGENNLAGAFLAIYRIRNNMFHGLKGHSALDDQIDLFKAMNAVLEEVIK